MPTRKASTKKRSEISESEEDEAMEEEEIEESEEEEKPKAKVTPKKTQTKKATTKPKEWTIKSSEPPAKKKKVESESEEESEDSEEEDDGDFEEDVKKPTKKKATTPKKIPAKKATTPKKSATTKKATTSKSAEAGSKAKPLVVMELPKKEEEPPIELPKGLHSLYYRDDLKEALLDILTSSNLKDLTAAAAREQLEEKLGEKFTKSVEKQAIRGIIKYLIMRNPLKFSQYKAGRGSKAEPMNVAMFTASEQLQKVIGVRITDRSHSLTLLWDYIKAKKLQQDHTIIKCDENLKAAFGADTLRVIDLLKHISPHLVEIKTEVKSE